MFIKVTKSYNGTNKSTQCTLNINAIEYYVPILFEAGDELTPYNSIISLMHKPDRMNNLNCIYVIETVEQIDDLIACGTRLEGVHGRS